MANFSVKKLPSSPSSLAIAAALYFTPVSANASLATEQPAPGAIKIEQLASPVPVEPAMYVPVAWRGHAPAYILAQLNNRRLQPNHVTKAAAPSAPSARPVARPATTAATVAPPVAPLPPIPPATINNPFVLKPVDGLSDPVLTILPPPAGSTDLSFANIPAAPPAAQGVQPTNTGASPLVPPTTIFNQTIKNSWLIPGITVAAGLLALANRKRIGSALARLVKKPPANGSADQPGQTLFADTELGKLNTFFRAMNSPESDCAAELINTNNPQTGVVVYKRDEATGQADKEKLHCAVTPAGVDVFSDDLAVVIRAQVQVFGPEMVLECANPNDTTLAADMEKTIQEMLNNPKSNLVGPDKNPVTRITFNGNVIEAAPRAPTIKPVTASARLAPALAPA